MKPFRVVYLIVFAPIVLALVLAACGSHTTTTPRVVLPPGFLPQGLVAPAHRCPPGKSFMGCGSGTLAVAPRELPVGGAQPIVGSPAGAKFVDVSSYQGCAINWSQIPVKGAVVKAWENGEDPCLTHNAQSLKAAHKPWTMYDFVRYCSAASFIALYNYWRPPLPPVLDEEVPQANGCTGPLVAEIERDTYNHVKPIEYTSPGTETTGAGAGNPVMWIADFGPGFPCLWTCHASAWQFASPPYVYFNTPGLGYVDTDVDYGMLELTTPPPKPSPTHEQIARWTRARNASEGAYVARGCPTLYQRIRWFGSRLTGPRALKRRRALAASRQVYVRRACPLFLHRETYFESKLHGLS